MAARKRSQLRRKISHRALGLPPAGLCAQPVRARPGLILRTSLILRTIRDPTSLIRALRLRSTDSCLSHGATHQELVRTPPPHRDLTQDSAAPSGANSPLGRTPQEQGAPLCSSLNQVDLGVLHKEITCHQDSLLCGVMIANCTTLGARPWPLSGSPGDNRDT